MKQVAVSETKVTKVSETEDEQEKKPIVWKKVEMPTEELALLQKLYLLRSYSGFEEVMRTLITDYLDKLDIPYINYNGNIVGINHPGQPLFSAHMDMVNTDRYKLKGKEYYIENPSFTIDPDTNIRLYRDAERKEQTSLGADDKNGIWCILLLLKQGFPINFIFSHGEEVGCVGIQQVVEDEELGKMIESCSYGVVIDRRNEFDIIGYENKYCMALDDKLQKYANNRGYAFKSVSGLSSDANYISKLIECVNLSCGYYEAHFSKEYTNLNQLWKTFNLVKDMVSPDTLFQYESVSPSRMQKFKSCKCPYLVEPPKKEEDEEKKKESDFERVWDYEKREFVYQVKKKAKSNGWDNYKDDEDDIWYKEYLKKEKKTTGGQTSTKEEEDETDLELEFDYSLEFRSDMQMMADDYTEIIAQGECMNCSAYGYFLWSDLEEAATYGYDVSDLEAGNQNIGVECMSCGAFMPLKEFKEHLDSTGQTIGQNRYGR